MKVGRIIVVIFCLLLATASSLLLVFFVNKSKNPQGMVNVVVVKQDIQQGTDITEENIGNYFEYKNMPKHLVKAKYVAEAEDILGKRITSTAYTGEILDSRKLETPEDLEGKSNLRELEIKFSDTTYANGSTIKPGDKINLIAGVKAEDSNLVTSDPKYPVAEVISVLDSNGNTLNRLSSSSEEGNVQTPASGIKIRVDGQEAVRIINIIQNNNNFYIMKVVNDEGAEFNSVN